MSNNYGPNATPGQVRNRIWAFDGVNPNPLEESGNLPTITIHEEQTVLLQDGTTERSLGRTRDITLTYNPNKIIDMRNPSTDVIGPVGRLPADLTMEECLAVFYALGRQAQTDQDIIDAG